MTTLDPAVIGTHIEKKFPGHGVFKGKVISADNGFYQVQYSDGDEEELSPVELAKLLPKTAAKAANPATAEDAGITPDGETKTEAGPRVRKRMNYSELSDEENGASDDGDEAEAYKPEKQKRRLDESPRQTSSAAAKKPRAKGKSRSKGPKLCNVLDSLDKKQLIGLIVGLTEDDGDLEQKVREAMPEPDVDVSGLTVLRNKIFRAFPYSRYGSSRDNYAYNRVSPHIQTFKKEFNSKLTALQKSAAHEPTLKFIEAAVGLVDGLPSFDNSEKNKYITQLQTKMYKIGMATIKKASKNGDVSDVSHFQEVVDGLAPQQERQD